MEQRHFERPSTPQMARVCRTLQQLPVIGSHTGVANKPFPLFFSPSPLSPNVIRIRQGKEQARVTADFGLIRGQNETECSKESLWTQNTSARERRRSAGPAHSFIYVCIFNDRQPFLIVPAKHTIFSSIMKIKVLMHFASITLERNDTHNCSTCLP